FVAPGASYARASDPSEVVACLARGAPCPAAPSGLNGERGRLTLRLGDAVGRPGATGAPGGRRSYRVCQHSLGVGRHAFSQRWGWTHERPAFANGPGLIAQ